LPTIRVIIPAYNEERSIGKVLRAIPKNRVAEIIVVDNNSSDNTYDEALKNGATVLKEPRQGYGYACLKGMDYIARNFDRETGIIVFLDADFSDEPEELPQVVAPIIHQDYDMVIGSRALGNKEKGSMTPQQVFGNWLATTLIRWFYGFRYTDLGPFRAIKWEALKMLEMQDKTYGWTVEMQLKAVKKGLKITEVPVNYKKRIGESKVSGTVKGTIGAGYKILSWIFKYL